MYHALPTNPPGAVLVTNERRKLVYTERKKFGSLRSPLVIPRTRLLPIPYFLHPTPPILVKFWVPLYLLFCTLNLTFSQIQNKRRTPGGKYPPLSFWVPGKNPPPYVFWVLWTFCTLAVLGQEFIKVTPVIDNRASKSVECWACSTTAPFFQGASTEAHIHCSLWCAHSWLRIEFVIF